MTAGVVGVAMVAAFAAAAVGVTAAAFSIGEVFDSSFDSIRLATGQTGAALTALKGDFKATFASVPDDANTVSAALSGLAVRTGLTGEELQGLTKSVLDFSRVTGSDASTNVRDLTRLFDQWHISTENQIPTMDKLLRASQATGIGVGQLEAALVKNATALKGTGIDFDRATALIGSFEKAGVNTEQALAGMGKAFATLAKDGKDGFYGVAQGIEAIQNAGTESEAAGIAIKLFGAKAGPELAAAVREGRFSVMDLKDAIANGSETVAGAVGDTQDFAEAWAKFSHQALNAVEPFGTAVFNVAGLIFDKLAPGLAAAATAVEPFAAALGGIIGLLSEGDPDKRIEMFNQLSTVFGGDVALKIALVTSGIIGLVDALSGNIDGVQRMDNAIDGLFGEGTAAQVFKIVDAITGFVSSLNAMIDQASTSLGITVDWTKALEFLAIAVGVSIAAAIATGIAAIFAVKLAIIGVVTEVTLFRAAFDIAFNAVSAKVGEWKTQVETAVNFFKEVNFGSIIDGWKNDFIAGINGMIDSAKERLGVLAGLLPHSPAKEGPLAVPVNWGWLFADMPRMAADAVVQTYGVLQSLSSGMRSSGIGDPTRDFTGLVGSRPSGIGDPTRDFTNLVKNNGTPGFFDAIRKSQGYGDPTRDFTDYVKQNTSGQQFRLGDIHVNVQADANGKVSVGQFEDGVSSVAEQVMDAITRALSNPALATG